MSGYQPWASSPESRRVMQANRSRDTRPELLVRQRLHAMGLRYRVSYRCEPSLRRFVDIAFTRARVAVMIDGCFWHACPIHGTRPKANGEYWSKKLALNVARDADTNRRLTEAGWLVLRFWEHEDPEHVAPLIRDTVVSRLADVHRHPRAN